jgi:hypothetical protein
MPNQSTQPDLEDFAEWMTHLGWLRGAKVGRSVVWHHIKSGNVYRLPQHSRVDLDRCTREVFLLTTSA